MLDKKTEAVLGVIYQLAGDGYKVLEKQKIINTLPHKLKIDNATFSAILVFLAENDYVDVKYQDKEEICICTTVKAKSYATGDKLQQKATISSGQMKFLIGIVFLSSFLGALVATLIGKLF